MALGPAVHDILNAVLTTNSSAPNPPINNNNVMVHCGKTKVFLTHATVTSVAKGRKMSCRFLVHFWKFSMGTLEIFLVGNLTGIYLNYLLVII